MNYVLVIGRILFALIFLIKAQNHFSGNLIEDAMAMGVPAANFFVPVAGLFALVGGLSVLLGYRAKIGAWLLAVFLFATAFVMHPFWLAEEPFTHMMHGYCFWKNISMLGASLMITYFGSGPLSLDSNKRFRV